MVQPEPSPLRARSWLPLTSDAVRQLLSRQVRHVLSPMVFVNASGTDYTSEAARTWVSQATKQAVRKAGIEDATFHSLMHTVAAWMVQEGATLFEVQNILDHSTPAMTQPGRHPPGASK